jgi:hypothetical protein
MAGREPVGSPAAMARHGRGQGEVLRDRGLNLGTPGRLAWPEEVWRRWILAAALSDPVRIGEATGAAASILLRGRERRVRRSSGARRRGSGQRGTGDDRARVRRVFSRERNREGERTRERRGRKGACGV